MTPNVNLAIAFAAGVVSFASPCCLPMVPVWLGYLVGSTPADSPRAKRIALTQAMAFVVGFTVVFVALWASVGLVGYLFRDHAALVRQVGGAVLIIMGLHVAKLIDIPLLYRQVKLPTAKLTGVGTGAAAVDRPPSIGRSALFGVVFAAGWTPCVGPILGSVIGMASISSTVGRGAVLLLAYALGLALPFVLVALGAGAVMRRLTWVRRHERMVSLVTGLMIIAAGFLMITNLLVKLSAYVPSFGL